jgi:hypothetical protein
MVHQELGGDVVVWIAFRPKTVLEQVSLDYHSRVVDEWIKVTMIYLEGFASLWLNILLWPAIFPEGALFPRIGVYVIQCNFDTFLITTVALVCHLETFEGIAV